MQDLPVIGTIDFYGLRTISEADVRDLLPFRKGDTPKQDLAELSASDIAKSLGVARIKFDFVCCNEAGLTMLYVGVSDTAEMGLKYHQAPIGNDRLPQEIVEDYRKAMDLLIEAVVSGKGGPDDISQGHSLLSYPPLRSIQNRFLVYAERDLETLVRILHKSSDAEHRAVSASVLGYVSDKAVITDDLIEATLDSDASVGNNATRSLGIIAAYAIDNPDLKIKIRAEPFIDLLNSGVWTDLNKGIFVLSILTKSRDPEILKNLQERVLIPLIDMCRWKREGHAWGACVILERIVGLPEQKALNPRETTIAKAMKLLPQDTWLE